MAGGHGKIVHFTSNQRNIVSKQWDVTVTSELAEQ